MDNPSLRQHSRREILSLAGILATVGCLGFSDQESSPPGLDSLYIRNQRNRKITLSVTVKRDSETVYEQPHTLDAWKNNSSFGEVLIEDDWLGEQAPYDVTIDVAEGGNRSYATGDFLEMTGSTEDFNCFEVSVVLGSNFIDFRPSARETCRH